MRKWIPIWVYPMVTLTAIATVWLRLSVVRNSYEVGQINQMIRNSEQELEKLELQSAKLRSPGQLKALAKEKFGLFSPRSDQMVFLKEKE